MPCCNSPGREMDLLAQDKPCFSPHCESRFAWFSMGLRVNNSMSSVYCRLQGCRGVTELVLVGRAQLSWTTWHGRS